MKRLKVIACEVSCRELYFYASQSNLVIDFTFMPRKLHIVETKEMQATLQKEIDAVDVQQYDAILLGYGLCGHGVVGLHAELPIVIPKTPDCIAMFLGSRHRYAEFKHDHPKGFYFTPGWLERKIVPNNESAPQTLATYKQYIDETIFINTGVGPIDTYRALAQEKCQELEATYLEVDGDRALLAQFLNGDWDEDRFTVIPPNYKIIATNDDHLIGYQADQA